MACSSSTMRMSSRTSALPAALARLVSAFCRFGARLRGGALAAADDDAALGDVERARHAIVRAAAGLDDRNDPLHAVAALELPQEDDVVAVGGDVLGRHEQRPTEDV